jgi:hypothetical protein
VSGCNEDKEEYLRVRVIILTQERYLRSGLERSRECDKTVLLMEPIHLCIEKRRSDKLLLVDECYLYG